ncbi:pentapeptide repeat-containing protein [Nostoc sp. LEGE 12447]|uniref:pentapeptide repeat-containing protein n=1 Tax=Nostoc sp. LEGE 12447 TaxID=1828640 RepID=UPI001883D31F|nr:pentapeptide repeat-containing protein [Nostoc sp. LEGE 12447]MBE9002618.1 pentapeptide repeat-containing protein [Nostoc sp. LEGE 12447]
MSQPPENLEPQQLDANLKQADSPTSQNVVQGHQNRVVQGEDNKAVLGDSNSVVQGNHNTQNIHITNYYYHEDIRVAFVKPTSDAFTDEELPCPYRGLYHFSPDDAEYFFGREVFIEELFEATKTRNFIPVLGASGSGKSSVVLAGLVPKLQQEGHWKFTHFRPGSNPFYGLAEALVPLYTPDLDDTDRIAQTRKLANYFCNGDVLLVDVIAKIQQNHPHHRVLLIADQFEELYTLCNDEKTRSHFLDSLLTIIQSPTSKSLSTVFVATMRVDFLSYALSYPEFADRLKADIKLIRSMNRSELSEVIVKPALKLGVTFQDGLIERILDDVESEPGNLPLLEFALTLLWEKRTDKQLTHAAYEAIGEVQGALASHADTIYKNLNVTQQQQVSKIFMQLVRPGEGTEDTRRVATKAELGEENWSLVQDLADARLVVTSRSVDGQETVEVAHEALIQHWQLLQSWIDENRSQIIQKNRIERLANEWGGNKKSPDYLLQGKQLNEAQAFQKKESANLTLSSLATEFIQQSIRYRRNNRLRLISFGFIPLVALAVFLGFTLPREFKISQLRNTVEQAKGQTVSPARILALQELVKLGVSLNNIPLNGAILNGAYFNGANLNGAYFNGANLNGANLESANLKGANLFGVYLSLANLKGANLKGANLESAILKGTNLNGANLNGAKLNGANLGCRAISEYDEECTNLSNAKNLTPEQVKAAQNWQQACYDPEFRKTLGLPPETPIECKN